MSLALPLATPTWLADRTEAPARLVLAGTGFLPVTLIAATAFGVAGLADLAAYVLVPTLALAAGLVIGRQTAGTVLRVVAAGLVATALYDVFRFGFLATGLMDTDPIPHIGAALGLHPDWVFGYAWRYLLNGGGLALAFVALGLRGVRAGMAYGVFVCSGLLMTLVVSPYGEEMLFPIGTATVVMAVGGHVIYGAVLGLLTRRTAAP